MVKLRIKHGFTLILIVLLFLIGYSFHSVAEASDNDPLISLSYFNQVIDNIQTAINDRLHEQEASISELKTVVPSGSYSLEVVELFATNELLNESGKTITTEGQSKVYVGTRIVADAGTEIILRFSNGLTTSIASDQGGLSDVTAGHDIANGAQIPTNHLLIIPRTDGRGVRISNHAIFMIRGGYTVE